MLKGDSKSRSSLSRIIMSSEAAPVHALSSTQERHLVNYLDGKLLEITGDYRKRYVASINPVK